MFEVYEVGGILPGTRSKPECTIFDMDDSGAQLVMNYDKPTAKEIENVSSQHQFQIRYLVRNGVIWILTKCGDMHWNESPYSPHLSPNLTGLQPVGEGQGLAITLILCDRLTGIIKELRVIGLTEKFTKALFDDINTVWQEPFDSAAYFQEVHNTMTLYTTKQLVGMAHNYCKIN